MLMRARHNRNRHRNYHRSILQSFFLFLIVFCIASTGLFWLDARLKAVMDEISRLQTITAANEIIDTALSEAMQKLQMTADDFYIQTSEENGGFSVNTTAMNHFCTIFSQQITTEMRRLENETIEVPFGSLSGLDILANLGPNINISMRPMGAANVDYESEFEAAGINQIHFQISVNVSLEIRIVNPLHSESIPMSRKIMLVDTVFSGDVPQQYFQFNSGGFPIDRTDKILLNSV